MLPPGYPKVLLRAVFPEGIFFLLRRLYYLYYCGNLLPVVTSWREGDL
jgi:hypothetical protein